MSFKKVKTVFIFDKPKCIYMKPKGTREYVKSKGEMVLLSVYLKRAEKVAAMKALASKMAKRSKAAKKPMKMMPKKKSVYGGFYNEEDKMHKEMEMEMYNKLEAEKAMEEHAQKDESQEPMTGGYYAEEGIGSLVSKEKIEELMSFLKKSGGKKVKKAKKSDKVKKIKHVSSVALMKRKVRKGGEGLNIGDAQYND